MGLFAPLAVVARRRLGEERALFAAGAVLLVGALVRMAGSRADRRHRDREPRDRGGERARAGVVRKRFAPERTGVMLGVYAMSMGAGSAVIAALMIPVWRASANHGRRQSVSR